MIDTWAFYFLLISLILCGLITFFIYASWQIWDVIRRSVYDSFLIERRRVNDLIEIEAAKDKIRQRRAAILKE